MSDATRIDRKARRLCRKERRGSAPFVGEDVRFVPEAADLRNRAQIPLPKGWRSLRSPRQRVNLSEASAQSPTIREFASSRDIGRSTQRGGQHHCTVPCRRVWGVVAGSIIGAARALLCGQGSRPQGRFRCRGCGASGCFNQVAWAGYVSLARRAGRGKRGIVREARGLRFGGRLSSRNHS
jgi:hypothetical protein